MCGNSCDGVASGFGEVEDKVGDGSCGWVPASESSSSDI